MKSTYTFGPLALLVMLLLELWGAQNAFSQIGKLYPVDEASQDSTFVAFRDRLEEAVRLSDTSFVFTILSPCICNSFGGDGGIAEFKNHWFSTGSTSDFWSTMESVLKLGGEFGEWKGKRYFQAPYVWSRRTSFDGFEYGVIIDSSVNVHESPSATSEILAVLAFDIVKYAGSRPVRDDEIGSDRQWVSITLVDGRRGFVEERFIRSKIGYRATFSLEGGRWLLTGFIAGD